MVRISDGRMSGTAAGTIVLHVTPEAAIGGPLAYVQNGDRIRLSVARREIALLVDDAELARRMAAAPVTRPTAERGYRKLFMQNRDAGRSGCGFRLPARRRHPRHRAQAVAAGPRQPAASAKICPSITVRASQPEPHSPNPQPDRRP